MTKANMPQIADAIAEDMKILIGIEVGPSGATWQDVAGTLSVNLRQLALALDEARKGERPIGLFSTPATDPINAIATIIDNLSESE